VDDDEDILTVLKRALELKNYEVKAFSDPVKARDYLRSVKQSSGSDFGRSYARHFGVRVSS
jgi:hypothetical protein